MLVDCLLASGFVERGGYGIDAKMRNREGNVPRSVILDVVFLDFLDVVVGLWPIHSFRANSRCQYQFNKFYISRGKGHTISMRNPSIDRETVRQGP
jgi:hypothetical protein